MTRTSGRKFESYIFWNFEDLEDLFNVMAYQALVFRFFFYQGTDFNENSIKSYWGFYIFILV